MTLETGAGSQKVEPARRKFLWLVCLPSKPGLPHGCISSQTTSFELCSNFKRMLCIYTNTCKDRKSAHRATDCEPVQFQGAGRMIIMKWMSPCGQEMALTQMGMCGFVFSFPSLLCLNDYYYLMPNPRPPEIPSDSICGRGVAGEDAHSSVSLGGWRREVFIPKCSHRVGRVAVPYAALFQLLKCVFWNSFLRLIN